MSVAGVGYSVERGEVIVQDNNYQLIEFKNFKSVFPLQNECELEELLSVFAHGFHVLFTSKSPNLNVVEKDPDDNKFIECAVALSAKSVITGDKT